MAVNLVDVASDRNLVRALQQHGPLDFYWGGENGYTFKKIKGYTSQELDDLGVSRFWAREKKMYNTLTIEGGYENFITNRVNEAVGSATFDNVLAYEKALLGQSFGLDINSSQRRSELSKRNRLYFFQRVIDELIDVETRFINDIITEKGGIMPPIDVAGIKRRLTRNESFSVEKLGKDFETYLKNFDKFFAVFFNRGLTGDSVVKEDTYDGFLGILQKISMQGNIRSMYSTANMGKFLNLYKKNEPMQNNNFRMANQYFRGIFNLYMTAEKNSYVKVKEIDERMKAENIKSISLSSIANKGDDLELFKQLIVGPFLSSLGSSWHTIVNEKSNWSGSINLTKEEIDIITKDKYWNQFYNDLIKTGFSLLEVTFTRKENSKSNTWQIGKFKGDIGEMIMAVLAYRHFGSAVYAGNKTFSSGKKSTADTVITVNSHSYGIQVKEYKKSDQQMFERVDNLYKKRDGQFFLKDEEMLKYFSNSDIYVLASLIELFHNDSYTIDIINKVLMKMNLGAIRSVQFENIIDKYVDKDVEYNLHVPLYRVRGLYYPASYVFFDTYKTTMELYEKSQELDLQKNIFKLKSIDMVAKTNIVKTRTGYPESSSYEGSDKQSHNAVVLAMSDQLKKAKQLVSLMQVGQN